MKTAMRGQKAPCCCNGNVVLDRVGGCFQEMTGLTLVSTAAAHGNVCPHRGSACMGGGVDRSLRGGKAGGELGM